MSPPPRQPGHEQQCVDRFDELTAATDHDIARLAGIVLADILTAHLNLNGRGARLVADDRMMYLRQGTHSWGLHAGNG